MFVVTAAFSFLVISKATNKKRKKFIYIKAIKILGLLYRIAEISSLKKYAIYKPKLSHEKILTK